MIDSRSDHIISELRAGRPEVPDLVTLRREGNEIQALALSDSAVPGVRKALTDLGLPEGALVVQSATGFLLPYPSDDPMIMRFIERTSRPPDSD